LAQNYNCDFIIFYIYTRPSERKHHASTKTGSLTSHPAIEEPVSLAW